MPIAIVLLTHFIETDTRKHACIKSDSLSGNYLLYKISKLNQKPITLTLKLDCKGCNKT